MRLDEKGIPILTDVVQSGETTRRAAASRESTPIDTATTELIDTLLESESFRRQMDEVTAALTRNARQRVERALRPVIERAIKQGLDRGGSESNDIIRQQLEASLPDIISSTARKESERS
ncbi:MAG: hypothetical protein PVJ66_01540 [Gammaproteobacteria bacterium]